jgi:hypothetical protein
VPPVNGQDDQDEEVSGKGEGFGWRHDLAVKETLIRTITYITVGSE